MSRRISGEILGVREAAELVGVTESMLRARVARRLVQFRKWSGRIIFIRSELMEFINSLPGCSLKEAFENLEKRLR